MTSPADHTRASLTTPASCCPEYAGLSRRGFLRAGALGAVTLTSTAVFGSAHLQVAHAATQKAGSVLVVLSLRGAVDGMSLVVPHGDPAYYKARPGIAVASDVLLAKDGFFGLHPNLAPLLPMWRAGRMAAVHATGLPTPNRSHFSAMEEVEDADPGSSARVGWLNRLIGRDAYAHPLRATQIGQTIPPTSLLGPRDVMAFGEVDQVTLAGGEGELRARRRRSLQTVWGGVGGPLGDGARAAMLAVDDFDPVRRTAEQPAHGARYPRGDLGKALAAAARTIRGDVGAEVITVDHGDWDHHADLGTLEWGRMQEMTTELGEALAAFFTDLGSLGDKVTVVALSEFGRRTKENANYGLDHGHGNVMFLLGAGVKGGYFGTWTPLTNTVDGDLLVTTDYRSVLAEVVSTRFDVSTATVFPGFTPERVGAILR